MIMYKKLECLKDFEKLVAGDKVMLTTKKGKIIEGTVDTPMTNRGYIDLNEIEVYVNDSDYSITVNVDKYLNGSSSLEHFLLLC